MAALVSIELAGLVTSILAIVFGLLVLKFPNLLRYLVSAYFILLGLLGLAAALL